MGVTFDEDFLGARMQEAQETPSELNNFLRLNLNIVTDADGSLARPRQVGEVFGPAGR